MKKSVLLLLALGTFITNSCKDDKMDNPVETPKTKTELITTGSWKTVTMLIEPALEINGKLTNDFNAQFAPCDQDDLVKFYTNGNGIFDEGPTKCDPMDDQTSPFSWHFDVAEKLLVWDGVEYTLLKLDAHMLSVSEKLKGEDLDNGQIGVTYTLTINMVH